MASSSWTISAGISPLTILQKMHSGSSAEMLSMNATLPTQVSLQLERYLQPTRQVSFQLGETAGRVNRMEPLSVKGA